MTVDQNGVTVGSSTISWDNFNKLDQGEQAKLLGSAGVDQSKIAPLMKALQNTEISQYKQYQGDQAHNKALHSGLSGAVNSIPVLGGITGQLEQTAADLTGGQAGGKAMERPNDKSIAQLQQQSGMTSILNDVGAQQQATNVENAASAAAPANTTYPAYSEQALNAYTNNYVMPIQKQLSGMISGDMSQWESAIGNIATATGQQGSPITQLIKSQATQMAPLMQLLGNMTQQATLNKPYLDLVNQSVGEQATIGARQQALGAAAQNIYQYGLIDPTTAQLGQQSSGGGALGAGGSAGLIQNLLNAPTAGVNTSLPGNKAGTTTGG